MLWIGPWRDPNGWFAKPEDLIAAIRRDRSREC